MKRIHRHILRNSVVYSVVIFKYKLWALVKIVTTRQFKEIPTILCFTIKVKYHTEKNIDYGCFLIHS